eukprot:10675-Heterococcus_DN1.PRE.3
MLQACWSDRQGTEQLQGWKTVTGDGVTVFEVTVFEMVSRLKLMSLCSMRGAPLAQAPQQQRKLSRRSNVRPVIRQPPPPVDAVSSEQSLIVGRSAAMQVYPGGKSSSYFPDDNESSFCSSVAAQISTAEQSRPATILGAVQRDSPGHHEGSLLWSADAARAPCAPAPRPSSLSIFYGTVSFSSTRVALWDRRPRAAQFKLTPEGCMPLLVLQAQAIRSIAVQLQQQQQQQLCSGCMQAQLMSVQHIAAVSADDPRVVTAPCPYAVLVQGSLELHPSSSASSSGDSSSSDAVACWQDAQQRAATAAAVQIADYSTTHCVLPVVGVDAGAALLHSTSTEESDYFVHTYMQAVQQQLSKPLLQCLPLRLTVALSDKRRQSPVAPVWQHQQQTAACITVRAQTVAPSLQLTFTPIAALPLLMTPVAAALVSRKASSSSSRVDSTQQQQQQQPQTGLLTLNEARRAVLLQSSDPLCTNAPLI